MTSLPRESLLFFSGEQLVQRSRDRHASQSMECDAQLEVMQPSSLSEPDWMRSGGFSLIAIRSFEGLKQGSILISPGDWGSLCEEPPNRNKNGNGLGLFSAACTVQGVNSHIFCGLCYFAAGVPLGACLSLLTVHRENLPGVMSSAWP